MARHPSVGSPAVNSDRSTSPWRSNRPTRWITGSLQRVAEGGAAAVLGAVLLFVFGILPGLRGVDSASTDVAPTPTPTTAAECLVKMSGESIGVDIDDIFVLLSTNAQDFSELWQANPASARSESVAFIDMLRFQAWKSREVALLVGERDIEFAGEIFDTAMAAVEAADLLQFDSMNNDGIINALARVSATSTDLARRIDYGC